MHEDLMREAIAEEANAQRALLAGDDDRAGEGFAEAARLYQRSWESAPPRSFGRLVGMLKATVLAGGDAVRAAGYVRAQIPEAASPPAWYALAVAAVIEGDDEQARTAAAAMRAGSPAFARAAAAVDAIAAADEPAFAAAIDAIVRDFETRAEHLTAVPIADTALMFMRLGARRGLHARPASPLIPA